jgi:hypothetical protein
MVCTTIDLASEIHTLYASAMAANKSESNHPFNQVWRRNCIIFVTEVNEHGPRASGGILFKGPFYEPMYRPVGSYGN